eukprot:Platyproteum_vivax@DN5356_c0_g1_i1.p2
MLFDTVSFYIGLASAIPCFLGLATLYCYFSDCDFGLQLLKEKPQWAVGKVMWVTGASSGIGKALAFALAGRGARLILSSRKKDSLETVKSDLQLLYPDSKVKILAMDVANVGELPAKVEEAWTLFGGVDVLWNNADRVRWTLCRQCHLCS